MSSIPSFDRARGTLTCDLRVCGVLSNKAFDDEGERTSPCSPMVLNVSLPEKHLLPTQVDEFLFCNVVLVFSTR